MNDRVRISKQIQQWLLIFLSVVVVYLVTATVIVIAQASYQQEIANNGKVVILESTVARLNDRLNSLQAENNDYRSILEKHQSLAAQTEQKLINLAMTANSYKLLADRQASLASEYRAQTEQLSSSVQKYEKLSKLDAELLKKYSKIYFLNENYHPSELIAIPNEYMLNPEKRSSFHAQALPFLERMLSDAQASRVPLYIVSGYRSYREQQGLKSVYSMKFGTTKANSFSADQGYSEHQLGTAVDLTTREVGGPYSKFAKTAQYQWLVDNAYKYGFVLSYPDGNSYYKYEPWHWRFVGIGLATYLYDRNQYLPDLDQRDIDSYLVEIFD